MQSTPLSGPAETTLGRALSRAWVGEGVVGLAGCLTLAGWALDIPELKSVVPGLVPMNPVTAVTFVLAAVTLRLVREDQSTSSATSTRRRAALGGAVLIVLVGGVTVLGYVLGRNLGLDQLLFGDDLMGNRIAPNTGLCFVLAGGALALLTGRFRSAPHIAQGLALTSVFAALLAIVGYIYHASYLNGFTSYIPMAVNTAVTFIVLSAGIIAARPMGLKALAGTDTIGGVVLRRLLPTAVLLPIVLGWLRLQGQRHGLYGTEFGVTLVAVLTAAMFAALVLGLARTLRRMDLARLRTEEGRDRYAQGIAARLHQELDRARRASLAPEAWAQRSEARARIQHFLTGDGLTMVFQPVVDLHSGAVVGVEALARFSPEPRRPPNQWFAEAWTVDLGIELELAAVTAALAQLPSLPEAAYLAVNVSPATILSDRFAAVLEGVPEKRLVVEITEHAPVDDYGALTAALRDLRSRGVRLAVDDVGAGISSLRHVTRLSPDLIKLDIALTRGIADDPVSQALAAALAGFARDAGIAVIAEGIENDAEATALRELGVGFGQGYHFARPGSLPLPPVIVPRRWQPTAVEDSAERQPSTGLLRRAVARADQRWNRHDGETDEGAPPVAPRLAGGRPFSWGATALLGALSAIVAWYIVGLPGGFARHIAADSIFSGTMGTAAVLCLRTGRHLGDEGRPWRWIGAGHAAYFAGTLVWNYFELWRRVPGPYPSLADVGFLGYYPLVFVGLLLILRRGDLGPSSGEAVLDGLIAAAVVGGILFEVLLSPLNASPGVGSALLASLAWQGGTLGLVYLGLAAIAWRSDLLTWRPMPVLLLAIGLGSFSNVAYAQSALAGTYAVGDLVDLGWHSSALLIAVAALVAMRVPVPPLPAADSTVRASGGYSRSALVIGSVIVISGWGVLMAIRPETNRAAALVIAVVGLLTAVRLGYAAKQGKRLGQRTRERDRLESVIHASAAISGTLDQGEVLRRLATATAQAVGRSKAEVYVLDEHGGIAASAAYGLSPIERAILARLAALPVASNPALSRVMASRTPTLLRPEEEPGFLVAAVEDYRALGKRYALLTPLLGHGEVLGYFALWTPFDRTPFLPEDVAAATAIGQEAGVAIHNARLVAEIRRQADTDGLTGLLNHRAILTALDHELARAAGLGTSVALLLMDLDNFKRINDDHGHLVGDRVLRAAATGFRDGVRDGDHVGRYGGDEFAAVLVGADADTAHEVADRLMARAITVDGDGGASLGVDVSIGVAVFPRDGASRQQLMIVADASMYAAKVVQRRGSAVSV